MSQLVNKVTLKINDLHNFGPSLLLGVLLHRTKEKCSASLMIYPRSVAPSTLKS